MPKHLLFSSLLFIISGSAAIAQDLPDFVQSQYPRPGATGVARNSAIAVRIAPAFELSGSSLTLKLKAGGSVLIAQVNAWKDSGWSEFVYRPVETLDASTRFTVTVSASGIAYQFDFTTGPPPDSLRGAYRR